MLLIEDLETASKTLFDGDRLANVKRCFCIDKQDRRRGHHLAYSRTGEPTSSPVPAYTGQPRMKTDIEIQIRSNAHPSCYSGTRGLLIGSAITDYSRMLSTSWTVNFGN